MAALLLSHLSLLPSSPFPPPPPPPSPSIPIATAAATLSRNIPRRSLALQYGCFNGIATPCPTDAIVGKRSVTVWASPEIDGKGESEQDPLPPSQGPEEGSVVPVENLPLESKMKERMDQKLRMKMAKKIRLRRNRLLRKRRMRKKGRWPPSKMKKLKNV